MGVPISTHRHGDPVVWGWLKKLAENLDASMTAQKLVRSILQVEGLGVVNTRSRNRFFNADLQVGIVKSKVYSCFFFCGELDQKHTECPIVQ